ncbi:MAG: metallophosphoesterase family protein [Tannerellaceae bacterium]|nr:metallophosphoesterase family protein [Tannerellaceae bacterium]
MKKIIFLLIVLCSYLAGNTQNKPLQFNENGRFKIVQFTDVHYIHGDDRSDISLERINEVLTAEKPDLVLFTGDLIYGGDAASGMKTVLEQVSKRQIPFGVLFGNHDDEHSLSREELFDIIKEIPYNYTATVAGLSGVTNFILPVLSGKKQKEAAILYCMDSHAYSQINGIGGYDYIKFDQIQWYRENSRSYTAKNGGTPIPSLAFFHIPLPEYNQAASDENAILIGTRKEKACAPQLNSGLFSSMKEMGDIQAIFVGHDHDCDYVVNWKGILLGYGRYTGGQTVYNNLPNGNGARVIELTEGEEGFNTWIRLKDNEIINKVNYPEDFVKK